jgi:hypothetical protein
MDAHIIWSLLAESGMEHLHLTEDETGITADGLVLGLDDGAPFRLSYVLRAQRDWAIRECQLTVGNPDGPALLLRSDGAGRWTDAAGEPYPLLDGCHDVDIRVTPFTNTLPIRRLALAPGASAELHVGYITVPDLSIRPVRQRYTCLARSESGGIYRYDSLDSGFRADLTVDAHGLVVEYPGIWKRVWASVT